MHTGWFPIRLEAARLDNLVIEEKNYAILALKKRAMILLVIFTVNLLISGLQPMFPDSKAVLDILVNISGIIFIIYFVRTGFALAMSLIFFTKIRDWSCGYIEVYNDHMVIRQRTRYINSEELESAEIWFEDLIKMWNSTGKSINKIYKYNFQHDRKMYVDEICFRFKIGKRSHAKMAARTTGDIFSLHFGGYNKEELLGLGKTVFSMAQSFNPDLMYMEEPIVYKRILQRKQR